MIISVERNSNTFSSLSEVVEGRIARDMEIATIYSKYCNLFIYTILLYIYVSTVFITINLSIFMNMQINHAVANRFKLVKFKINLRDRLIAQ